MKLFEKELSLYGKADGFEIISEICRISENPDPASADRLVGKILDYAFEKRLSGNLFKKFIACLIMTDENAFSLSCERRRCGNKALKHIAAKDIDAIRRVYLLNTEKLGDGFSELCRFAEKECSEYGFDALADELCHGLDSADDSRQFFGAVCEFYYKRGVGIYCAFPAFSLAEGEKLCIKPVERYSDVCFDDLWGYEIQKNQLIENTEAFIEGKPSNNVLLFGDSGTGKSTCIKALLNKYSSLGLRIVEVNKYQFCFLKRLSELLKNRNYFFVFYLDDLSFEDGETEYKYLKAVIEGGIEPIASNILIYATSNRRHLIKETWSDRNDMDDDIHHSDTVQEKISLADRFGIAICFSKPLQKDFFEIVTHLAKHEGINMSEDELIRRAKIWGAEHGALSGRSARQFINFISGIPEER